MDFFALINSRHSRRSYSDQAIEREKITAICQAINSAPSAGNMQAFALALVANSQLKQQIAQAAYGEQYYLSQAALHLVFATDSQLSSQRYGERGENLYALQDCTIAASFAMLAAGALGLVSVWVGGFDESRVSEILNLPSGQRPIAILALGYPNENEQVFITPRRNIDQWLTQYL